MCHAMSGPCAVEVVLRRHPCVLDAAAVETTDRTGHRVMAAVVRLALPVHDATAELTGYCRRHLPAAQVPAEWVITNDWLPPELASRPRIPLQVPRAPHLDLLYKTTPRHGNRGAESFCQGRVMSGDPLPVDGEVDRRRR
jgi:acyl-CoA synthetase (AMP-forming)/AMP-acid ligase II